MKVKPAAFVAPNFTAVTPVKPVPVMVTTVPPAVGPAVGEIDVTVCAWDGELKRNAITTANAHANAEPQPFRSTGSDDSLFRRPDFVDVP